MGRIINFSRSLIVACDVKNIEKLRELVELTYDMERIGGYKVGSILALQHGLPKVIGLIREFTDLPIIYDHQKAMTDIPEMGEKFVETVKKCGADALIGFPQSGPKTQETWIKACQKTGLEAIVGGEMTHQAYKRSEGGYIADEALDEIYVLAAKLKINNFVVPGNRIDRVRHYKLLLQPLVKDLVFYSTGLLVQGGMISQLIKEIGGELHVIIGRAIYEAKDIRRTVKNIANSFLF